MQLRLLAQFASARSPNDVRRLDHFALRYLSSFQNFASAPSEDVWTYPTFRLARVLIALLRDENVSSIPVQTVSRFLSLLTAFAKVCAHLLASCADDYYKSINNVVRYYQEGEAVQLAVLALLEQDEPRVVSAYAGFASEILTQADIPGYSEGPGSLSTYLSYSLLAEALHELLFSSLTQSLLLSKSHEQLLWLLAYFVFFRNNSSYHDQNTHGPDAQYVKIVSKLIAFLANDIEKRIDIYQTSTNPNHVKVQGGSATDSVGMPDTKPLPDFVRSQILSLISQENVSDLLAKMEASSSSLARLSTDSDEASALASYVLTLLRVFSRRKDEILMWLYRGSTSRQANKGKSLPATKYFYQAASSTAVFQMITQNPQETLALLRHNRSGTIRFANGANSNSDNKDQEWRIILLFLELYTFILKVMDDEEFLAGSSHPVTGASWTKQSALPFNQIETLTIFLKNLAFSMYWNASDIAGIDAKEAKEATTSLAAYFGKEGARHNDMDTDGVDRMDEIEIGGVNGMTLTSGKGLVTGVLRMLYERE